MCSGNCNKICKYSGANFDFLGVSSGDNVDSVLTNIMSYLQSSLTFSSTQGESGIVLYDGVEYTTPGTVSNISLDLQNMSDGDTYVLEFIVQPNFTNVTLNVSGLAVNFLTSPLTLIASYKVVITFSKDGSTLLGDYTVTSTDETFEGTYTNSTLFSNNTLAVNITGTHAIQLVNVSRIRSVSLKFFKQLI